MTALWPRGVLNEMNRNSQNTLFLDQFQTRLRGGKPGLRGPENDRLSLFLSQFQIRCGLHVRFAPLLCRVLSSYQILLHIFVKCIRFLVVVVVVYWETLTRLVIRDRRVETTGTPLVIRDVFGS